MAGINVSEKPCSKCKETKSLSEFYNCKTFADGLDRKCKTCRKATHQAYNKSPKGRAFFREYAKLFRATGRGKAAMKEQNKYANTKERFKKYREANKEKTNARRAVHRAVVSGQLPRASKRKCNECPNQARGYHHHLGYAKEHRLHVIPLCLDCHGKKHRKDQAGGPS